MALQSHIILSRPDRVPSSIQITAFCTSCIMILVGQANAWYGNEPETSIIKDIKRKIAIAVLLVSPNVTVIGGLILMGMASYIGIFVIILIIILVAILMLIYWICHCCKRQSKNQILILIHGD